MNEEVAEKSEEEIEIIGKELLDGIDASDEEGVNLQAITGTSDFTLPTLQEVVNDRKEVIAEFQHNDTLRSIRERADKQEKG